MGEQEENPPQPVEPVTPEPGTTEPEIPPFPDEVQKQVFAVDQPGAGSPTRETPTRSEILEAIAELNVVEFMDLQRRFKIAFALNGLSDEYRQMTVRDRMGLVERIIEEQDAVDNQNKGG